MRIMLDTNVLISSIIFKSKIMNELIAAILKDHRLVLSSFVIEELKSVVQRKFEGRAAELDHFLTVLPFEYVYTPDEMDEDLFEIRDEMDYPVLYSAIVEDVDILITGDKDFSDIDIEKPEILTPNEFFEKYVRMNVH
ncbi:MAG: putative toxin-antitoxin system toxin component, PIN family [Acetobacterium sp. MES1]|uniref:putative toxin-antitoxin system toxin component, PIN family n=1 Tax=Acetobacterium sp. MES1 TaxID=1899015 RepID=UPI000B9D496A|nr:putative toxin-antitoxin system toxin component, PIN family [Acetobacterium sp. MES1]OXS25282.1 MAG: putative toxin-antitoxin system toxin component, PIN family [Acetobacterium sp. MES1]